MFGVKIFNPFPSFTSLSPSGVGMSDKCSGFPRSLSLIVSVDFSFSNQSSELYVSRNKLSWSYLAPFHFFQNLVIHCIHQNRVLENYYIIPKLDYIHFFPFFSFCVFSLTNLFKSWENSTSGDYFHLRETLDNICKTYSYSYILDMIYCSFQVLFFLF